MLVILYKLNKNKTNININYKYNLYFINNGVNITNLKVHISRPIGAKKYKCLQCTQSFITLKTENNKNNTNKKTI